MSHQLGPNYFQFIVHSLLLVVVPMSMLLGMFPQAATSLENLHDRCRHHARKLSARCFANVANVKIQR